MTQTNTQVGQIALPAHVDLTSKEGYLVKIVNDGNVAKFALPTGDLDYAVYVLTDAGDVGEHVAALPLSTHRNVRIKLTGTCTPGQVLVLHSVNWGTVTSLPTSPGNYRGIAIAEEPGVDGQLVKARPLTFGKITV